MGYLASYRTKATEFNPMNPPRYLIWSIHDHAWRTGVPDDFTTYISSAYRYTFEDAEARLAKSNFRSGNTPNEAMVPEPKESL